MFNNLVGERVRLARLDQNMTQEDLAAKLELDGWPISRAGIAKIEIGIRKVTDIELMRLSKALKVSPNWLLSYGS
jgi:transcriptional regulator with XRE-family HTH domain